MVGAIEILRATDGANSRSFIIETLTDDTVMLYAEGRAAGEQYDVEALVTGPGDPAQWVVVQNNVNADFQRAFVMAPGVIHRMVRADANDDFAVHAQSRLGGLALILGPAIADTTARTLDVGVGAVAAQDTLRDDFELPRAGTIAGPGPYRWTAESSSANATVTVDEYGVLEITGVVAGAATITLTVEDRGMRVSKELAVMVA